MHNSEYFTRNPTDDQSRFWTMYEQVAKQEDQDFLDRQNTALDGLLSFVGFFQFLLVQSYDYILFRLACFRLLAPPLL